MKILISLLFIVAPSLVVNVFACSCSPTPPIYDIFDSSDGVFIGKVIGYKDVKGKEIYKNDNNEVEEYEITERVFQFEVNEVFKGVKGKLVEINVGRTDTSCSHEYGKDGSYLIYARKDKKTNTLYDSFCSPSTSIESAQSQILFIREKLKGKPQSQIYGSVVRSDTFPNSMKSRMTSLEGIKIILEGKEKVFETVTDKNGLYRFNKIPDGEYKIQPLLNSSYKLFWTSVEKVKIFEGKVFTGDGGFFDNGYNGAYAEFTIGWNNSVEGRVLDSEGKFVKFASVRLLPISSPFELIESNYILDKLEGDKYFCRSETPGRYYLVTEIYAPFGTKDKVRIFYPQAETIDKATPIQLKAPQELSYDFILPSNYIVREIKGKVLWSDGQPAKRAKVALFKTESHVVDEDNDEIENQGYDSDFTDDYGNFTLQGFEGAEYWIHFEDDFEVLSDEEEDIEVKGTPFKIKLEKENEPIKLILTKP